jgi:ribokinase
MVTVDPGVRARAADLAPLSPRAVAATLEQIDVVPEGVCAFITCGDDDARAFAGRLPRVADARRPRALIVNRREAAVLTGASTPGEAAAKLTQCADIAAVTLGPDGAVAVIDGEEVAVQGSNTAPLVDTTGAGDLFAAALAWADLLGAAPEVALQWANLYAGLSVSAHTGTGGAVTRDRLLAEGRERGLPELPGT